MQQAIGFNFYDVFVVGFCVIFALICFLPMWYVLVASVTPYEQIRQGQGPCCGPTAAWTSSTTG